MLSELGFIPFNKSDLVGIIFGPRTPPKDVENIKDFCVINHYKIKFSVCNYSKQGLKMSVID